MEGCDELRIACVQQVLVVDVSGGEASRIDLPSRKEARHPRPWIFLLLLDVGEVAGPLESSVCFRCGVAFSAVSIQRMFFCYRG
jgi:hypothetical protein